MLVDANIADDLSEIILSIAIEKQSCHYACVRTTIRFVQHVVHKLIDIDVGPGFTALKSIRCRLQCMRNRFN